MDEYYLRIKPDKGFVKSLELWKTRYTDDGERFADLSGKEFLEFLDSLQSTILEMVIKKQATRLEATNEPLWQFTSQFAKDIRDLKVIRSVDMDRGEAEQVYKMTSAYRKIYKRDPEKMFRNEKIELDFDEKYYREGKSPKFARFVTQLVAIGNNLLLGYLASDDMNQLYKQLSCMSCLRAAFLSTPCDLVQLLMIQFNLAFTAASLQQFVRAYSHMLQSFKIIELLIEEYKIKNWFPKPLDLHHLIFYSGDLYPVLSIFPEKDFPEKTDIKRELISLFYLVAKSSGTPLERSMDYDLRVKNGYFEWVDKQFTEDGGKVGPFHSAKRQKLRRREFCPRFKSDALHQI